MIVISLVVGVFGASNPTVQPRTVPPLIITNPRPFDHKYDADLRNSMALGCRDGEQEFCFRLGLMLRAGAGGPADPAAARRLFHNACRHGLAVACREEAR
jgi:TPR repeat protein